MKWFFAFSLMLAFCLGCGSNEPASPPASPQPPAKAPAASSAPLPAPAGRKAPTAERNAPSAAKSALAAPAAAQPKASEAAAAKKAQAGPTIPPRPDTELKQAQAGVGEKGHYEQGIITTPVSVFFTVQERIAFEIQVPHALQLFKAMEGRPPKDQAEFMQKIIKANQIKLPELPPGHRYLYNPKTEQLMVEYPRPKGTGGK